MSDDSKRKPALEVVKGATYGMLPCESRDLSAILSDAEKVLQTRGGVALPETFNLFLEEVENKPLNSKYSLASIVQELVPRLEDTRRSLIATGGVQENYFYPRKITSRKEKYNSVVANYLQELEIQLQQEFGGRSGGSPEKRYLDGVSNLLQREFVDAYTAIAHRRDHTEKSFWYKYGYGNRYAVTALTALPGLATLRMPYSTPIVMGALGFLGYKYMYPFIQRKRDEDLENLMDFTVHRQKALVEEATGKREQKQNFELPSIMKDLVPQLELARIGWKGEEDFREIVRGYLGKLHQDFIGKLEKEQHSDYAQIPGWLNEAYFIQLAGVVYDEFLPRFEKYAASQNRKEEHGLWYKMLSNKWVGAALTVGVLSPLYFATTRVLPFGVIDDVLMAGLFAVSGYNLPKFIDPGQENLQQVYQDICLRQEDLDKKIRE